MPLTARTSGQLHERRHLGFPAQAESAGRIGLPARSGPALGPVSAARLLRAAQVSPRQHERLTAAPAIDLFEYLGARWYRVAWSLAPARTARLAVVAEVADRFRQARLVLNHVADRCLFPAGNPWFAPPAA